MTEGLITRIGKWIDHHWATKATEADLEVFRLTVNAQMATIESILKTMDVADLKTRLEKMELYSGMTRKVDPTKPAVAKSAFQM